MMHNAHVRKTDENPRRHEPSPRGGRNAAAKIISLVVAAAGLAVMAGWIFDVGALKSLSPHWISMKFSTAFAFVMTGISLYFLARAREGAFEKAQVALSITSFTLAILMGLLFFSAVFGVETGIERLFVNDPGDARSVAPGMPSIPTMLCFLLIAAAGILAIVNPAGIPRGSRIIGRTVCAIGALAAVGYGLNAPLLYYYIAGVNSAMALHTALLFVACGAGLACL